MKLLRSFMITTLVVGCSIGNIASAKMWSGNSGDGSTPTLQAEDSTGGGSSRQHNLSAKFNHANADASAAVQKSKKLIAEISQLTNALAELKSNGTMADISEKVTALVSQIRDDIQKLAQNNGKIAQDLKAMKNGSTAAYRMGQRSVSNDQNAGGTEGGSMSSTSSPAGDNNMPSDSGSEGAGS